jgi:hypothetical protein
VSRFPIMKRFEMTQALHRERLPPDVEGRKASIARVKSLASTSLIDMARALVDATAAREAAERVLADALAAEEKAQNALLGRIEHGCPVAIDPREVCEPRGVEVEIGKEPALVDETECDACGGPICACESESHVEAIHAEARS